MAGCPGQSPACSQRRASPVPCQRSPWPQGLPRAPGILSAARAWMMAAPPGLREPPGAAVEGEEPVLSIASAAAKGPRCPRPAKRLNSSSAGFVSRAKLRLYPLIMQEIAVGSVRAAGFQVLLPGLFQQGGTGAAPPSRCAHRWHRSPHLAAPAGTASRVTWGITPDLLRESGLGHGESQFTAPGAALGTALGSVWGCPHKMGREGSP